MKKLLTSFLLLLMSFFVFSFPAVAEEEQYVKITISIAEKEYSGVGRDIEFLHYFNGEEFQSGDIISMDGKNSAYIRTIIIEQDDYPDRNAATSKYEYTDRRFQRVVDIEVTEQIDADNHSRQKGVWRVTYTIEPSAAPTPVVVQKEPTAEKSKGIFTVEVLLLIFGVVLLIAIWGLRKVTPYASSVYFGKKFLNAYSIFCFLAAVLAFSNITPALDSGYRLLSNLYLMQTVAAFAAAVALCRRKITGVHYHFIFFGITVCIQAYLFYLFLYIEYFITLILITIVMLLVSCYILKRKVLFSAKPNILTAFIKSRFKKSPEAQQPHTNKVAPPPRSAEHKKKEPIAVTEEELGLVIFELSRSRAEEIYHVLIDQNRFDIHNGLLQIYAFLFSIALCKRKLLEKYSYDTVKSIISTAHQLFFQTTTDIYGEEISLKVRPSVTYIDFDISEAFEEADEDVSYNPLRTIAKSLLWYCSNKEEEELDESIIFETTLEVTAWIKFSEFLLTDYTLTITNENSKPEEPSNPESSHFCIYCGAEIPADDAAFCYRCGKPLFKK